MNKKDEADETVLKLLKEHTEYKQKKEVHRKLQDLIYDNAEYFTDEEIMLFPVITGKESILRKKQSDKRSKEFELRMIQKYGSEEWSRLKTVPKNYDPVDSVITSVVAAEDMIKASQENK